MRSISLRSSASDGVSDGDVCAITKHHRHRWRRIFGRHVMLGSPLESKENIDSGSLRPI
jgi:hypothetical protein